MAQPNFAELAQKHGVRAATVQTLWESLQHSHGRQAQFSLDELGGMGQWMPGMVMVGRMGDAALKTRVDALCTELAGLIGVAGTQDAPKEETKDNTMDHSSTSQPHASATGSQNGVRYAYFATENRLVIEQQEEKPVTYDATGYEITGVSQSQTDTAPGTLAFTTKDGGTVNLDALKRLA